MKQIILLLITFLFFNSLGLNAKKSHNTLESARMNDKEFITEIRELFPENEIKIINSTVGRFAVATSDSTVHIALSTSDYTSFKGYKGYSNLLIILDHDGNIETIIFVLSDDTKPYVQNILKSKIFSVLSKQNIETDERPSYLVSGATITSNVFTESINKTLDSFKQIYKYLEFDYFKCIIPDSLMKIK